jgi:hypothetical protein
LRPEESFSQVIKRARWEEPRSTGRALLEALESAPPVSKRSLDRLEHAQRSDAPPENAWSE